MLSYALYSESKAQQEAENHKPETSTHTPTDKENDIPGYLKLPLSKGCALTLKKVVEKFVACSVKNKDGNLDLT